MNAPPSSSKPTISSTRARRSSKSAPSSPSSRLDLSARFASNKSIYLQGVPADALCFGELSSFYGTTTWRVGMDAAHARISESRNWKREQRQASRLSCVIWPASSIEIYRGEVRTPKLSAVRGGKPAPPEHSEAL